MNLSNYLVKKNLLFTRESLRRNNAFNCYCPSTVLLILASRYRAVDTSIEHMMFIVILSSFIFLSSLLEEESTNISLETSLGQVHFYLCSSLTLSE